MKRILCIIFAIFLCVSSFSKEITTGYLAGYIDDVLSGKIKTPTPQVRSYNEKWEMPKTMGDYANIIAPTPIGSKSPERNTYIQGMRMDDIGTDREANIRASNRKSELNDLLTFIIGLSLILLTVIMIVYTSNSKINWHEERSTDGSDLQ